MIDNIEEELKALNQILEHRVSEHRDLVHKILYDYVNTSAGIQKRSLARQIIQTYIDNLSNRTKPTNETFEVEYTLSEGERALYYNNICYLIEQEILSLLDYTVIVEVTYATVESKDSPSTGVFIVKTELLGVASLPDA